MKQRKAQLIIAATVFVLLIGGAIAFAIVRSNQTAKKVVATAKITEKKVEKPTAPTADVQAELNTINSKSPSLDVEIDGAGSGLSDQQSNLTY